MLRRACHWNRQTIYGSGRTHRSVDALQLTKLISRYRSKLYLSFSSSGDPGVNRARTHAEAMWKRLSAPREELNLHFTLPTGQSFRWRKIGQEDYIGLIGERVVQIRHTEFDTEWRVVGRGVGARPDTDEIAICDYFNMDVNLTSMARQWAAADAHYRKVSQHIKGARMLRQDPVECLFQFICSSNNHIARIGSMVEHLCKEYGTRIPLTEGHVDLVPGDDHFFVFPSIEQLQRATEGSLRDNGFGYRARYIVETAQALQSRPEGGKNWLLSLRSRPYDEVIEELTQMPGVGPKVAACIALFSCDKHSAIPVDTHVWKLACKHYLPKLKDKSLTAKLHPVIMEAFVVVFGEYAGWAHNALFVSELAAHKHLFAEPSKVKAEKSDLCSPEDGDFANDIQDSVNLSQASDSTAFVATTPSQETTLLEISEQMKGEDMYSLEQAAGGPGGRVRRKRQMTPKAAELALSSSIPRRARRIAG